MKIKNNVLAEFIKESSLSGEHAITEVKLDFNENGLDITAVSSGNTIMIRAQLPKKSFEEYAEFGKIGVINYSELTKVLSALKEDVVITKEGNMLVFKGGRTIEVPLADESIIKDIDKMPNLKYENTFPLHKKVFTEIENNLSLASGSSDAATVRFIGVNKQLTTKYGTKYKFTDVENIDEISDKFEVKFGQPLFNAVHNLTGDLTIQMKSEYPITIMKKNDLYAIKIIVAPKVES